MTASPTAHALAGTSTVRTRQAIASGAFLLTGLAFWNTWMVLPSIWSADRSHGFVAAALCGWLIWRDREQLMAGRTPWPLALPALVALSMVWLAGVIISAEVVQIAMLPLIALTWLVAVYGLSIVPAAWPIAAVFSLAVPLWEVLVWPLQMMTVLFTSVLIKLLGIEAVIRGESISLPSGTLVVAGSCSGINYLMTAVTVATTYAMLFTKQWPTRWRVIAAAACMALLANWIRVFGLVLIAHQTKMQSPLIKEHGTYGWVIFAVAMLVFFVLASRFERQERVSAGAPQGEGHAGTPYAIGTGASVPTLAAATLAAITGPVLFAGFGALPRGAAPVDQVPGLAVTATWAPAPDSADVWRPAFKGATESRAARVSRAGVDVQLNRLVFGPSAQHGELLGSGNRIAPDSATLAERVVGPLDANARMVREAAIREGETIRLVWYWYRVANVDTPSASKARLLEIFAFATRAPGSELVTVSSVCRERDCKAATATLFAVVTGREMPAATAP
jgi:exosortase